MNGGNKHRIVSLVGGENGIIPSGEITCQCGWSRAYAPIWQAFVMHDHHVAIVLFGEASAAETSAKASGN